MQHKLSIDAMHSVHMVHKGLVSMSTWCSWKLQPEKDSHNASTGARSSRWALCPHASVNVQTVAESAWPAGKHLVQSLSSAKGVVYCNSLAVPHHVSLPAQDGAGSRVGCRVVLHL